MGGDLRRVGRWGRRCGFAAWGFVALAVLPVAAEPQSNALDGRVALRAEANRLAVELDEARAAAERAERELGAERERARELAERALDPDFARGTSDGEALERRVKEIADARTRLAVAERDLEDKSSRLTTLEAAVAKVEAEKKRVAEELAARARDLEQTSDRAAKTEASLGHAHAERKRLSHRLGSLEREIASAQRAKRKSGYKGATKSRQIATRGAKGKRHPLPIRIRDGRQAARNRAPR